MTHIFIINPTAGRSGLATNLREQLSGIVGLRFFIFVTRHKGDEFALINRIRHYFEGEKLRIYCCGGSGTFRNVISAFGDISDTEFAFFPCGNTNDLLKMFGGAEVFSDIRALINGRVTDIDYIKTNHGIALNTLSLGLDADMERAIGGYGFLSAFSDDMPYVAAAIHSLFVSTPQSYHITLDGEEMERTSAEVVFANGSTLGGSITISLNSDVYDGMSNYLIAPKRRATRQLPLMAALIKKQADKINRLAQCGKTRSMSIRRTDGSAFTVNFDGEMEENITVLEAQMVHKGLHFVLPSHLIEESAGNE